MNNVNNVNNVKNVFLPYSSLALMLTPESMSDLMNPTLIHSSRVLLSLFLHYSAILRMRKKCFWIFTFTNYAHVFFNLIILPILGKKQKKKA